MTRKVSTYTEITLLEPLEPRLLLSSAPLLSELLAHAAIGEGVAPQDISVGQNLGRPNRTSSTKPRTRDDIGNTFGSAESLLLDSLGAGSLTGTINYAGDVDVLSIVATQTGRMQVDLIPNVNKKHNVSGDLSAYDSASLLLGSDTDPTDVQARTSFDVVSGQTYYVKAAALNGTTGNYSVRIATVAAAEPAPAPEPEPEPSPDPGPVPEPIPPGDYAPGSEVTWQTETLADGLGLVVLGTDGSDRITVSRSGQTTLIYTSAGTYSLTDSFVSIELYGFGGDDLLVSISGASEAVWGGSGVDSFWADSHDYIGDVEAAETAAGSVHQIAAFYQPTGNPGEYVSLELAGQDIVDPASLFASYDYSATPLFVDGPQYDDVIQGGVGDCYFLAALSSLADSDPGIIEQMIAPLGDGTYAVRFHQGGDEVYLRVDAEMAAYNSVLLANARVTPDGELWVALAEKAYAQFRTGENSYDSLIGGWMDPVYTEITNAAASRTSTSTFSDAGLAQYLADNLAAGHAVSAGSNWSASEPIAYGHAYTVRSIENVGGEWYVTVYNVWGQDGNQWDGNYGDGLLTISLDMFTQNFSDVAVSTA